VRGLNRDAQVAADRARDAEIEDLRLAAFGDEHVRGLEIAMDDAAIVRVLHGLGHLHDQLHARAGGSRSERE
jgi:hypothetical protein